MKNHMFAEGEKGCPGWWVGWYVGLLMNRLVNQTVVRRSVI